MSTLTLDDLRADIEAILKAPLTKSELTSSVRDQHTHSIGRVLWRVGSWIDECGKPVQLTYVKVMKPSPKAHHKKGDFVIWREAEPCGL